jgi:acyl transferase domain-containing protein
MGLELNGLGVLNPDGVSYSFDERANGYGRSEGIGAIVLKRMSDALRDGDSESHLTDDWHTYTELRDANFFILD